MENLGMNAFADSFRGRKILLTGHTGFKGSWLALWLRHLGAEVTGVSLPPDTTPSHWSLLNLPIDSHFCDIADFQRVKKLVHQSQPELVLHLAAQPLVRLSYQQPLATWQTNLMGTANVLEACKDVSSVKAIVAITTDKVYENKEAGQPFSECDPLGGFDPYSASKAACELLVQSYRRSFFENQGVLLASARAGNVIGGGDWAMDRLIPDVVRSMHLGAPLEIRYPSAIRPWQHVLDSLSGYLCLAHRLLINEVDKARAWNFGPDQQQGKSVSDMLQQMKLHWPDVNWQECAELQVHEAQSLRLNSAAAQADLGWRPVWSFETSVEKTAQWYKSFYMHQQITSQQQLENYIHSAQENKHSWANH